MLWKTKYRNVIGNSTVQWATPKDLGGYDDAAIKAKDTSFNRSKGAKKHTRKVIEYEKFLGIEENIRALIL